MPPPPPISKKQTLRVHEMRRVHGADHKTCTVLLFLFTIPGIRTSNIARFLFPETSPGSNPSEL